MDASFPNSDSEKRLSLSFHRTFSLSRDSIRAILELAVSNSNEGGLSNKQISEQTNLGTIYVEAMPRYAYGSGLLNKDRSPTEFGRTALFHDSLLLHPSTQWLMHYFMSAPHGPGPLFWTKLVTSFFIPGEEFRNEDIVSCLMKDNDALKEETISDAKTAFIGSYVKNDGFGSLGLILEDEERAVYQINYPDPPPVWAMAAAFLDFCQVQYPGVKVVNLDNILDGSDFSTIFMVGARRINQMLSRMQEAGYVELFNSVPPYGIAILRTDTAPLMEKMYGNDSVD